MLSLQCLFSRLRKYLVFFSPSLYHLALHLKIAPWQQHRIISSNLLLHDSSCSAKVNFCTALVEELPSSLALVEELPSSLSRKAILFSKSCSLSVVQFMQAGRDWSIQSIP